MSVMRTSGARHKIEIVRRTHKAKNLGHKRKQVKLSFTKLFGKKKTQLKSQKSAKANRKEEKPNFLPDQGHIRYPYNSRNARNNSITTTSISLAYLFAKR